MNNGTPFPGAAVPIIGQPFTLVCVTIPVHAQLTCNCGGEATMVTIMASAPGACPTCGRTFIVSLNPTTMKLEVAIVAPGAEKEPS